jgi:hypothetical protein
VSRVKTIVAGTVAVGILALLAAGPAEASVTRYASPTGSGSGCTQAAPCTIFTALGASASGDTVLAIGNAGSYGTTGTPLAAALVVEPGVSLEGVPGQPRPVFLSSAAGLYSVRVELGAQLEGVDIHKLNSSGWALFESGSASRVIADAPAATGCGTSSEAVIINSICTGEYGIYDAAGGPSSEWTLTLRNDTIIGLAHEAAYFETDSLTMKPTAVNTILRGNSIDVRDKQTSTGTVEVTLDHSNYATVKAEAGASITPAGSGANQTAPPQFVQIGIDLHQAPGSPTIDAGTNDLANGATDLDGNPRALSATLTCGPPVAGTTDIGAYEFVPAAAPPCPPPVVHPRPPTTEIGKASVKHRRAKFTFEGAGEGGPLHFECKLDRKPFSPCSSPKTYKHLHPGHHKFQVRAVNAEGVADATPALRSFRIAKPAKA